MQSVGAEVQFLMYGVILLCEMKQDFFPMWWSVLWLWKFNLWHWTFKIVIFCFQSKNLWPTISLWIDCFELVLWFYLQWKTDHILCWI